MGEIKGEEVQKNEAQKNEAQKNEAQKKRLKKITAIGFSVIILFIGAALIYTKGVGEGSADESYKPQAASAQSKGTPSSASAPDFSLPALDGKTVKLSDYRGKVVILNFWASWCPPCKQEMPELEIASREFSKKGNAILLGINVTDGFRETEAKARAYIQRNNFTMSVLLDRQLSVSNYYRAASLPTTVILGTDGGEVTRIVGPTTYTNLNNIVNKIQNK